MAAFVEQRKEHQQGDARKNRREPPGRGIGRSELRRERQQEQGVQDTERRAESGPAHRAAHRGWEVYRARFWTEGWVRSRQGSQVWGDSKCILPDTGKAGMRPWLHTQDRSLGHYGVAFFRQRDGPMRVSGLFEFSLTALP